MWIQYLRLEYGPRGYKLPLKIAPKFAYSAASVFSKDLKLMLRLWGRDYMVSNQRMAEIFGVAPLDIHVTIVDAAASLIDFGEIPPPKDTWKNIDFGEILPPKETWPPKDTWVWKSNFFTLKTFFGHFWTFNRKINFDADFVTKNKFDVENWNFFNMLLLLVLLLL